MSIVTLAEARINGDTMQKLAEEGSDSSSYILVYNSIEDIVDSVGGRTNLYGWLRSIRQSLPFSRH